MDTQTKNNFADWLYNRFVENFKKKDFVEAFIFLDVLSHYQSFAMEMRKLSDQRRHIKELYNSIIKALKEKRADQLSLTGNEAVQQWNAEIQAYENRLREMGLSEEYILQKVSDKKMYDNGNKFL